MKKKYFVILLAILFSKIISAQILSDYQFNIIKEISVGISEGMIGWKPPIAGSQFIPQTIASSTSKLYIPDMANARINVYDFNLNFLKTIVEKNNIIIPGCQKIFVDKNENITGFLNLYGIKKINKNGNEIYSISRKQLPKEVLAQRNIFLINDDIFFYNDEFEIQYIDNLGNIYSTNNTIEKLSELSSKTTQSENLSLSMGTNQNNNSIFKDLLYSKQYLLAGYNFYSTDINKTKKFFSEITNTQIVDSNSTVNKNISISNKNININIDEYDCTLYGYDNEHNSYWGAGKQIDKDNRTLNIIIFDKFGNILDGFQYGELYKYSAKTDIYPTSDSIVAIAPSGDVYFMVGSSEKYTFYKITRQW